MPFPVLPAPLSRALIERSYLEPTSVQSAVLEAEADDRDLLVSAQTGSGKTVAFGLAVSTSLLGQNDRAEPAPTPLVLVIAPTRELAMQVRAELEWLYGQTGARVISCVGGMDIRREAAALIQGGHIVVGTPGRLRDHMERGRLDVSALRAVVLDEADEMLNLGFREDLEFMLDLMPAEKRTLLFSATIPREIASLARRFQKNALRIDTVNHAAPHVDIDYRAIRLAPNEVEHGVVNLLRFFDVPTALVFCSTREAVKRLHASLVERGFSAVSLSGEMSQSDRTHALQALRDGRARVCVATDVAARGLDLPGLDLVVHADLPNDKETLLHRSGRTGRAGRKGVCAILVPYNRRRKAEMLISGAGVDVAWGGPPTAEEIRHKDRERFLADPIFTEENTEEDLDLATALLIQHTPETVASALIRLYRSRMPEPEEVIANAPENFRNEGRRERGRSDFEPSSPRDSQRAEGPMVWFRMNIGRTKNADPRWLLPMICRLGHVTKREIGAIRIFDADTKFEIMQSVAAKFAAAIAKPNDEDIKITSADGSSPDRKPSFKKEGDFGKNTDYKKDNGFKKPWKESAPRAENAPAPEKSFAPEAKKPFERKPWQKDAAQAAPYPSKKADGDRKPWQKDRPKTAESDAPKRDFEPKPWQKSAPSGAAPSAPKGDFERKPWQKDRPPGAPKPPFSKKPKSGKPKRPKV